MKSGLLWGALLGLLVYAAIAVYVDWQRLVEHTLAFPIAVFIGALALTLINYAIRFYRWNYFLRIVEVNVPVSTRLHVFLAGFLMSISPGKVGEVLKSVLLFRACGVPMTKTTPVVIAERLSDLVGLLVIASVGVIAFEYGRLVFAIAVVGVIAGIGVLQRPRWIQAILERLKQVPGLSTFSPKIQQAYTVMAELLAAGVLVKSTALSMLAWAMEALAFYWILITLQPTEITIYVACFIYAMTTLVGALSLLPGGLGAAEGSMIAALLVWGTFSDESLAVVATYLIRFSTLWFGVVIGAIALVTFRGVRAVDTSCGEE